MFGADVGRLPRDGSTDQEVAEARRVFYVGLTRAEVEIHMIYTQGRASRFVSEVQRRIENGV
ncbi:DNA helicase IV [compost metagenome]